MIRKAAFLHSNKENMALKKSQIFESYQMSASKWQWQYQYANLPAKSDALC